MTATNPDQRINAPRDRYSFGHTLFRIIGKDADWHEAAKRLGIGFSKLKGYVHSTHVLPLAEIEKNRWRQVLAQHYPQDWKANRDEYNRLLAINRELHGDRIPANNTNSLTVEWRRGVGALLKTIRESSGLELEQVTAAIRDCPVVSRNLEKMENGSRLFDWTSYRAAALYVYRICADGPNDPNVPKLRERLRAAQPGMVVSGGPAGQSIT